MIERHIVAEGDADSRIVIGPPSAGVEASLVSIKVVEDGEEVTTWDLGPDSARAIVEEIRHRATGRAFL